MSGGIINRTRSSAKAVSRGGSPSRHKHRAVSAVAVRSGSIGNLTRTDAIISRTEDNSLNQIESQYVRNLQQQIYYLELENAYLKNEVKKNKDIQPKIIGEADHFLDKLRKSHHAKERAQHELQRKETEITHVVKEKSIIMEQFQQLEEVHLREKRILSEEIVELKKRLDDTVPDISRKQAELTQTQSDLQEALKKYRATQRTVELYQSQLDQKGKEETTLASLEVERQAEMNQLFRNIKELECELSDERSKVRLHHEEINSLRRQLRELELQSKKDKAVSEKVSEENNSLIRENSQLATRLSQLESQLDQVGPSYFGKNEYIMSELAAARENERQVKHELLKTQDLLRIEQAKTKKLSIQLSEQENAQTSVKETQTKLHVQMESLEGSSKALSSENQKLRQDKIILESKHEEIRQTLSKKDLELESLRDRLAAQEQQQKQLVRQFQDESRLQDEKCREIEHMAQQFREMSRNLRHSALLAKSTTPDTLNSDGL